MNNTRNDESPEWFAINATIVNRKARDDEVQLPATSSCHVLAVFCSILDALHCLKFMAWSGSKWTTSRKDKQNVQQGKYE